jgi:integrase
VDKIHDYRGIKITEYVDRRSGLTKFRTRFQLKNKEYAPKKNSLEALKKEINRIFTLVDEGKDPKDEPQEFPTVDDVLKAELKTLKGQKWTDYNRVYTDFLSLIPPLRIDELTQADFNAYIEFRQNQTNERTGAPIKNATINKELSAINVGLKNAVKRFRILHNFKPVAAEKLPDDYKPRTRTVQENEFELLFNELRKPRAKAEREYDYFYRLRLADYLEFDALTGLRRAEICLLKPEHYDARAKALVDWRRPKTDTEVVFFPLRQRATEIIEERIRYKTEYLFSDSGKPLESHYRKLKNLCQKLNIKYGSFTKGGFVMHDLRRNFGTEMLTATDIKTASEFLGHADLTHTGIYLATDKQKMINAVRKLDGADIKEDLRAVLEAVKEGKLSIPKAINRLLKLWQSR